MTAVAVVVPAYNAEATIRETLDSIRGQTHRDLDIVVVDDGSTDSTPGLVEAAATRDQRIRLFRQPNRGVATARNTGVAASRAPLIAPCDADDLWHPRKIEKQIDALDAAPRGTALAYTWSASIDQESRVLGLDYRATDEGDVLRELARGNFLGNASCALFTRDVFMAAGGYDSRLRAMGAEGCEDWRLYIAIAARGSFACVREYLTGYRVTGGAMSSRAAGMLSAHRVTADAIAQDLPGLRPHLEESYANAVFSFYVRALRTTNIQQAWFLLRDLRAVDPRLAVSALVQAPRTLAAIAIGLRRRQMLRERLGWARAGEPALGSVFGQGTV